MPPQEKFGSKVAVDEPQEPMCPASLGVVSQSLDPSGEDEPAHSKLGSLSQLSVREEKPKEKDVDFDDLLPHVGEFGTYQKILFCLMVPFAFYVAWVYFSQIFITLVPEEHWCKVPELMDLPVERRLALLLLLTLVRSSLGAISPRREMKISGVQILTRTSADQI